VHGSGLHTVAGHAQIFDKAFLAGFNKGFERTAGSHGLFPFVGLNQAMHLP
jgi:hypothetical protein